MVFVVSIGDYRTSCDGGGESVSAASAGHLGKIKRKPYIGQQYKLMHGKIKNRHGKASASKRGFQKYQKRDEITSG